MLKEALQTLVAGGSLTRAQARASVEAMLQPEVPPAVVAGWLVALRMKGESVDEIAGVVEALRARAESVDIADPEAVDTCGTGGDGASTFNISTAAAFVVAGAGVTVAKHGNRAVSSKSGSADVLAALGVNLDAPVERIRQAIDREGIGFLFAQRHHAAMRFVGPVRRELGVRTVFNVAGPLSNPAGVKRQLVGVYDPSLLETLARTLGTLGGRRAWVVHGGGLDEISLAGETLVASLEEDGSVRRFTVTPEEAGLARASIESLSGGDAQDNARLIRALLEGEKGPRRDAVLLNSGAALVVAGRAADLREGAALAAESIDGGAALGRLEALVRVTSDGAEAVA